MMQLILISLALTGALVSPALAHPDAGSATSFASGVAHPLGGPDHVTVMTLIGLWAALRGGAALWVWPTAFVSVMLIGGALGMTHIAIPFVEPGILASVVTLGLMVALAADPPVSVGATIIGAFALLHGHAHGAEAADTLNGLEYMAGFALATATLHALGVGFALALRRTALRTAIRLAGAACVAFGVGLFSGVL
jgi:urease accessory protein